MDHIGRCSISRDSNSQYKYTTSGSYVTKNVNTPTKKAKTKYPNTHAKSFTNVCRVKKGNIPPPFLFLPFSFPLLSKQKMPLSSPYVTISATEIISQVTPNIKLNIAFKILVLWILSSSFLSTASSLDSMWKHYRS